MFLDRQNIPAIVDLDCDKRLDLFIGRVEGTVTRYEADSPGGLRFGFITERFEDIEIIGRIGGGTARHGANAIAFADFDGDGDVDLFWGDFFEPGMLLIENIGPTCSTPSFQVDPVELPYAGSTATSGYNAPAPVDIDRDGDLDFLMGVIGGSFNPVATSADNFYFWERVVPDRLELKSRRYLQGIDLGSDTVPAAADFDGDGDLDLAVGTKLDPQANDAGRLVFFWNDGTPAAPRFRQGESLRLADAYHYAPAFGDVDGDGDLDLFLGTWNQDVLFFRNRGSAKVPRWEHEDSGDIHPPRATSAVPALTDFDGDGDLDLVIGQASGPMSFYRNDGTPKSPKFTLASERLGDLDSGRRSAPRLHDVDGDGLPDLVSGREIGGVVVYRNLGTRSVPRFAADATIEIALPLPPASTPVFVDLNGDGKADVLSGSTSGGLVFFRGS
jgi:hypothetical protein